MRNRPALIASCTAVLLAGAIVWVYRSTEHPSTTADYNNFEPEQGEHAPPALPDAAPDPHSTYVTNSLREMLDISKAKKVDFDFSLSPNFPERSFIETELRRPNGTAPQVQIGLARVDLDSDGSTETAFYIVGNGECGAGNCDLRIYQDFPKAPKLIFDTAAGPFFYALPTQSNGYADLAFPATGADSANGEYVVWRWAH